MTIAFSLLFRREKVAEGRMRGNLHPVRCT